jgi:hypothetical protein
MTTTAPHSDQYSKSVFSRNANSFADISKALARALSSTAQFNIVLSNAFSQSYPIYLNTLSEYNKSWKNLSELDRVLKKQIS